MKEPVFLPVSLREKGYSLVWREETGSTNADALEAARSGHHAPCWFVAGKQASGRGRSGREWISPEGNLYASLLLRNPCEIAVASQLGFVTGIALHDAISRLTGMAAPRLQLKWPNDVLLDGKKLVGLLLEAQSMGSDTNIAIGCGINVTHRPQGVPYSVATVNEVAPVVTIADMFEALSLAFDSVFSFWQKSSGKSATQRFAPIRSLWLERAAGIGEAASLRLPQGKINGVFAGIDGLGRLELQTDKGMQLVDAGDLFFPGFIV